MMRRSHNGSHAISSSSPHAVLRPWLRADAHRSKRADVAYTHPVCSVLRANEGTGQYGWALLFRRSILQIHSRLWTHSCMKVCTSSCGIDSSISWRASRGRDVFEGSSDKKQPRRRVLCSRVHAPIASPLRARRRAECEGGRVAALFRGAARLHRLRRLEMPARVLGSGRRGRRTSSRQMPIRATN